MSYARISVFYYSLYLAGSGAVIAFAPNFVLGLVGLPPTNEAWIRIAGFLALALGSKGVHNSQFENRAQFQFDNYTRGSFGTFAAVLVALDMAPPILWILVLPDYLGVIWTQLALRADKKAAKPAS